MRQMKKKICFAVLENTEIINFMSTEFNSNIPPSVVKSNKTQPLANDGVKKAVLHEQEAKGSEAVPFGQDAVAGKSQISQPESVKKDVAFMAANPNIVNMATEVFERALKHYEDEGKPEEEAYALACMAMNQFKREMCEKS